jgi:ubiquinone/menaquinone biosynthesis C-methylase UbiE
MAAKRILSVFGLFSLLASFAYGDRVMLPPFCQNAYKLLSPGDSRRIQIEDTQLRELFIMQALGPEGMAAIRLATGFEPFHRVQSLEEALAIVDRVSDDPTAYGPVNTVLNDLSGPKSWALYLNTGFHAVSTYTDGHREMVQKAIDQFPGIQIIGHTPRFLDVGIGNGNLVAAAAIEHPQSIVQGLDIAGAGLNISTYRLNELTDIASRKFNDPGLENVGRFWVGRGSASDGQMFKNQKFDAASMVLTLFAVPSSQRQKALQNIYDSLEPGGRFVLIDPIPKVGDPSAGRKFLREIVKNAYKNNTDLTAADLAILTAKNAHNLLKTDFLTAEQQRAMGEAAGFKMIGRQEPAYYGICTMTVFEKPL